MLRSVTLFGIVAVLLISQTVALAGTGDTTFVARSARVADAGQVEAFAVLTPQPGNELRFVVVQGEDGGTAGVGIVESVDPGVERVTGLEQLRGASPVEVFHALSREGTALPRLLTELYGEPTLGTQGWAIPQADMHSGSDSSSVSFTFPEEHKSYPRKPGCQTRVNSYPSAWLEPLEYGLDNFSSHFIGPMSGPLMTPGDWTNAVTPPAWSGGGPYRNFAGQAESVTAFSTSVMLCDTAFFFSINGDLIGKNVVLYTRPASMSQVWQNEYSLGALDAVNKVISFQFHPMNYESALAPRLDFRLEIQRASEATSPAGAGQQGDRFYIGAAWHEMSNGDFPTKGAAN